LDKARALPQRLKDEIKVTDDFVQENIVTEQVDRIRDGSRLIGSNYRAKVQQDRPTRQSRVLMASRSIFETRLRPLLAGQFKIGVEVRGSFRDRLATECIQELKAGFFKFGAAFACWQSSDPKQYFAPNDGACNDAINRGQTGNPAFDPGCRPHQINDGVCVQEIDHPRGNSSNVPGSRTGRRAEMIAASKSSAAAALG
jgi:hypothetical protein